MKEEEIYKRLRRVNQIEVLAKILADISNGKGGGGGDTPEDAYKFTSYIIDQRDPQKPYIIKDVPSMNATETMEIDGKTEYVDVIARIRDHSFVCLGYQDRDTGYLDCYPTDKTDKLQLIDGTQLGEGLLSSTADMFMKLPEFWWKCEDIDDDPDYVKITFTDFEPETNEGWNHWKGNTFIGVYKGYIDNGHDNIYRSIMAVEPENDSTFAEFKDAATSRNFYGMHNYSLISYQSHCIMALLGYGWFGSTDAASIVGFGGQTDEMVNFHLYIYPRTTGGCDIKGMTDTVAGVDGDDGSTNFWGLEDWWGDNEELIDNVVTSSEEGDITVYKEGYNFNNAPIIKEIKGEVNWGPIHKFVMGSEADLIPSLCDNDASDYTVAYSSCGGIDTPNAGMYALRSGISNYMGNNLSYIYFYYEDDYEGACSRLQFVGSYRIYDENNNIVEVYEDTDTPDPDVML